MTWVVVHDVLPAGVNLRRAAIYQPVVQAITDLAAEPLAADWTHPHRYRLATVFALAATTVRVNDERVPLPAGAILYAGPTDRLAWHPWTVVWRAIRDGFEVATWQSDGPMFAGFTWEVPPSVHAR